VLTKEDLQHVTALSQPGDDSGTSMKRPQLTTSALRKGLQMAADLWIIWVWRFHGWGL